MSAVGTTRNSNLGNASDLNGYANSNMMEEPDLSHLPQWKRDFILKKKALIVHQKEQEQKKFVQQNGTDTQSDMNSQANNDVESNDSSIDSDSDTDKATTKGGGYSFETGQRLSLAECSDSDSSSLVIDTNATKELKTESDTSSAEIPYQPGFVSKLLNKWSRINSTSQTSSNSATEAVSTSNSAANSRKTSPPSQTYNKATTKQASSTIYDSRSISASHNSPHSNLPSNEMFAKSDNSTVVAVAENSNQTASSPPRKQLSNEIRDRRPSFRNPEEIVLIEAGSPRDEVADFKSGDQIMTSSLHSNSETGDVTIPSSSDVIENDMPIHEKVQLARAVFEFSSGGPVAPPRRKKIGRVTSPPNESAVTQITSAKAAEETQTQQKIKDTSLDESKVVDNILTNSSLVNLSNNMTADNSEKLPELPAEDKEGLAEDGNTASKLESPPSTFPTSPYFAIKLKPTNHSLFGKDGEKNAYTLENASKVLSPRSKRKYKAPSPPISPDHTPLQITPSEKSDNLQQSSATAADRKLEHDAILTVTHSTISTQEQTSSTSNHSKPSIKQTYNTNSTFNHKISNSDIGAKTSVTNSIDVNDTTSNHVKVKHSKPASPQDHASTKEGESLQNKVEKHDQADRGHDFEKPRKEVTSSSATTSSQSAETPPTKQESVDTSATTTISSATTKKKSVFDIPNPAAKTQKPKPVSNGVIANKAVTDTKPSAVKIESAEKEENFMDVLKKRKEAAEDVPVTNIDDILEARRSGGSSKVVFDTRKSMGNKRKVPEYEKIRDGPVVQYTQTSVVVGKSCLKVVNTQTIVTGMKKNLSFNELNPSVHEYPSEKIMIAEQPKEEGAVYWDDPDHLQAAPDRSIDEPEAPATTSSSLVSGKANIASGSFKSLNSSKYLVPEYSLGQSIVTPSNDQLSPAEDNHNTTEGSTEQETDKPAEDTDYFKSFSSTVSSDLLFW